MGLKSTSNTFNWENHFFTGLTMTGCIVKLKQDEKTLERRGWAQTMKAAIPHKTGASMISYDLVRLRHIKHLLRVRKRLGFGFKYLVLSQQTWRRKTRKMLLKTSDFVATNVAWISVIVAGKCPCVASKPAVGIHLSMLKHSLLFLSFSLGRQLAQ